MQIRVSITGERPLLLHNGRLANPLNDYVREIKKLTGKMKKTDEDLLRIAELEARGAAYETADGKLGLPTQNVWRSIYDAAKSSKRGEDIKRALIVDASAIEPLLVDGEAIGVNDFLRKPGALDYRPVVVARKRTMRARPLVTGWSSEHTFELLTDVLMLEDLIPIIDRAGRLGGLGDWRPAYGTFKATVMA